MHPLRAHTLALMERVFERFASGLAPPVQVPMLDHFVFRFAENSIEQALVQKLARIVSGLYAADALLELGFLQEQGALHRILDELGEDVLFLAIARTNDCVTPLHERYLAAFNEEHAPPKPDLSRPIKGPDSPTRRSIRAYIKNKVGPGIAMNYAEAAIAKAYSGYIHAASQNIMDMYGGEPPRFHLRGMAGTPMQLGHAKDAWNYLYRGLMSFEVAGKAFGVASGVEAIRSYRLKYFAEMSGP
jgi:hypothetical protein